WQQLLGVERVGVHDNFFELGGHSLLVMRMIWGIRKELSEELAVKEVFIHPTIASLSAYLESRLGTHIIQQIEIQPRPEKIPLSFSQERLWFIDQMEGSVQYHINAVLRLNGILNQEALEKSLQYIVNRHEVLRTVFLEEDGRSYQQIKEKDLWQLDIADGAKYKESDAGLQSYIQQLVKKPFNLSKDFMLRATLLNISGGEHLLVVTMHHIASDGWSMGIMVKEVASVYNSISDGTAIGLIPFKIQYADYSIWQRNYLQGELLENKLSYWKNKLTGVTNLELPTDYQRPSVLNTKGAVKKFVLDKTFGEQLHSLSQDQGTTIFMTLLAGFKVLLHRYSGQEDICVGSPIANRTQQEVEGLIGFFVNTLSLRSEVTGATSFKDFLQQVKITTLEAYEHQDIPFEKIVEVVVKERDLSRTPLFQVMFVLQTTAENTDVRLGNLKLSREVSSSNTSKFEMTFSISENENGLQVSIEYNTNLYKEETIDRMMSHYKELLGSIIKNPQEKISKLKMLTSSEEKQLLFEFNDAAVGFPHDKNIVDLFEAQVQKTPNNIAIVFQESDISYIELNKRSNQLAHLLRAKGVKEDTLVPICIERSIDMMIGLLAILKAGGAYVPVDPEYPEDRINYMLENAGSRLVVTSLLGKTKLHLTDDFEIIEMNGKDLLAIRGESEEALKIKIKPSSIAYVIHTSGSTGKPKGVMIEHRNVVRLFETDKPLYDFNESDVWTMFHSFCFDFSVWEMYGALFYGGRIVIVPSIATKDTVLFAELLLKEKVTVLNQTPSSFYVLQDILVTRANHVDIRYVIFGGEALNPAKLKPWKQLYKNCKIINMYGITETTVHVTYQEIGWQQIENGNSIIGKTIPTLHAYVLDDNQNLLPIGVPGELCIGGEGLARGYLNREDLTVQKFIKNPFINDPEARIYRSGDLGRWMPDGTIEYLGRLDDQVKIRGYRIELGEIETVALQSGLIKQVVVLARSNSDEGKRLIGYVVADGKLDKQLLTSYLHTKLPDYMVPQVWVQLDYLLLTSNGKIDKKALPDPGLTEFATNEYVAPRNELESGLAEIWKELLHVDRVGIHDNFFELGGHSLLVIILVSAIRKRLKIELTINDIFINPTIADFADNYIEKIKNPSLQAANIKYLVPLRTGGNKVPIYIVCGEGGTALLFKSFAESMDPDQPVYALQLPVDAKDLKTVPDNIEEIARLFIEEILINNPEGPYALAGHCLGGFIAFEIAKQLKEAGKRVRLLAMFDTVLKKPGKRKTPTIKNLFLVPHKIKNSFLKILFKINFESFLFRKHTKHAIGYKLHSLKFFIYKLKNRKKLKTGDLEYIGLDAFKKQFAYSDACKNYKLSKYEDEVVLFYAKERYYFMDVEKKVTFKKLYLNDETKNMWNQFAKSITIHEIEGEHSTMFETAHNNEFANLLQGYLNDIRK
ncbi:MAG: amino acid adenylation domain-containing protein, partial [Ginsengibacter sp.]